ncbi:putative reverse transcriptase domain-containing protein [Tanacetum coccineum]
MPQEDEVFPAEEKPLPAAISPTTQSLDYVMKSDPEADPEEDYDEDPEEDLVDYPANGGDDGDDEDESSEDDADDDVDIEANDDEEEEEHPAPADSTVVALPAADQAPSAEETEPFETDESPATPPPHPAYRVTTRISIPAPVPTPVWSDAEIPSPPLPLIPSPSLPVSPPLPVSSPVPVLSPSPPVSPIRPLGYRAAMIRLRAEAASTSYSLPLPPPIILSHTRPAAPSSGTPPLHLLSTDHREDIPEVTLPPRKRLGIALGPAYKVRESSSAGATRPAGGLRADYGFVATMDREIRRDLKRDVGYGITDSWDEIVEAIQGTLVVTDVVELSQRMTEFETRVRRDIDEVYARDRRAHARTAWRLRLGCLERLGDDLWIDAGGRSQEVEAAHKGTEADKETLDSDDRVRETAGTRQSLLSITGNSPLSKIASTSFAHLSKQVLVEELKEKSISEVEVLTVVEEEGDTWMTPIYKYLAEETLPADMKKARAIKCKSWRFAVINGILYKKSFLGPWLRFGLPGEIISDNGKQFRDNPFKDWLVERANRSLGEGIKARLEARSKNWMEELPHVLWAHRTMIKSSNGDTPFSLTYRTEAVIPAEIGMPTIRTAEVDLVQKIKNKAKTVVTRGILIISYRFSMRKQAQYEETGSEVGSGVSEVCSEGSVVGSGAQLIISIFQKATWQLMVGGSGM